MPHPMYPIFYPYPGSHRIARTYWVFPKDGLTDQPRCRELRGMTLHVRLWEIYTSDVRSFITASDKSECLARCFLMLACRNLCYRFMRFIQPHPAILQFGSTRGNDKSASKLANTWFLANWCNATTVQIHATGTGTSRLDPDLNERLRHSSTLAHTQTSSTRVTINKGN